MAKVLFVAPIYNYAPILLDALQAQTYSDWELLLVHDGPNETGLRDSLESLDESRLRYYESPVRHNDWGHSLRAMALEEIEQIPIAGEFVVITNADNYYVPGYLERILPRFDSQTVGVYCSMLHNYVDWTIVDAGLRRGQIDCGCLMVRREAMLEVGWASREEPADWFFVQDLVKRFGTERLRKVSEVLFVHN